MGPRNNIDLQMPRRKFKLERTQHFLAKFGSGETKFRPMGMINQNTQEQLRQYIVARQCVCISAVADTWEYISFLFHSTATELVIS